MYYIKYNQTDVINGISRLKDDQGQAYYDKTTLNIFFKGRTEPLKLNAETYNAVNDYD